MGIGDSRGDSEGGIGGGGGEVEGGGRADVRLRDLLEGLGGWLSILSAVGGGEYLECLSIPWLNREEDSGPREG